MICPACADAGRPVDMDHVEGESAVHDPGARDGVGFVKTCCHVCPVCGRTADCERDHYTGPDRDNE